MEVKDFESGEVLNEAYLTIYSLDRNKSVRLSNNRINSKFREAIIVETDKKNALYKVSMTYSPTVNITLGYLSEEFLSKNFPKAFESLEERLVSA